MGGLFSALNAGKTALSVNQKSIEVIGNNISNVNTEGYSRQDADLTPYPSLNFGGFFVGQGVTVSNVSRDHDTFVTNMLQDKSSEFGLQNGQTNALAELERIFSISEENISTEINRFFDSWQELSANPSGLVERDIVIQRGELLADKFNLTIDDLNKVKDNINDSLLSKIDDVNSQITEIAELNQRIFTIEVQGQTANSARDRRDMLAKELSTSLGTQTYYDNKGMMAIQLPGGLPLVQGNLAMEIEGVQNGSDVDLVLHAGGTTRPLGLNNLGGEFQGLVNIRDQFIPAIKDDLDRLAFEIIESVNLLHGGNPNFSTPAGGPGGAGLDSSTGVDFFTPASPFPLPPASDPWKDAARNMSVSITDSSQVAAAAVPTPPDTVAPGDNRNALLMSNVGENHLIDNIDNFAAYYAKLTAQIGIESKQNQLALGGAEDAMIQLENVRDGIAGVSLDEEMINLIQYQRGFESSAKFLSTIDEMMVSLINLKR